MREQTDLHLLIQNAVDEHQLLEQLRENTDDINAQDCFGLTAVHYAVEFDFVHVLRFLLNRGGNTQTPDIYGDSPLDVAYRYYSWNPNHEAVCKTIKAYNHKKSILFKCRFLGRLMCMYRQSVHNVYKPYGVGYYESKKEFESLLQ
jgi:hypothetical protein